MAATDGVPWDDRVARLSAAMGGDPARGRQAMRALERLRSAEDPRLRELAQDVLDGRRTLREMVQDDAFGRVVSGRLPALKTQLDEMTPEDRERLLAGYEEQRRRDLAGG
ncbi:MULTISPECIES: hypothetical protein [unclassified Actinotalea]|uniref:hypothetical protein n=1 Tax=unclassified Actinotalea TaxID=2638618 RepID=UPI0015F399E6|nr:MULTISPECIES: hypothetical protein [unclassified Actinotalea]